MLNLVSNFVYLVRSSAEGEDKVQDKVQDEVVGGESLCVTIVAAMQEVDHDRI